MRINLARQAQTISRLFISNKTHFEVKATKRSSTTQITMDTIPMFTPIPSSNGP
jgi:hypothetical protein